MDYVLSLGILYLFNLVVVILTSDETSGASVALPLPLAAS
jgi:hypothetical protein